MLATPIRHALIKKNTCRNCKVHSAKVHKAHALKGLVKGLLCPAIFSEKSSPRRFVFSIMKNPAEHARSKQFSSYHSLHSVAQDGLVSST